ncbi:MAG: hypothetical protein SH809_12300 [Rhodothermales bacterium]|nr:hypothetical protein [Rhodothermales bacterium]
MRSILELRATLIASALCVIHIVLSLVFGIETFEGFLGFLARFEPLELDEIFLGLVIVLIGALWDLSVLRSRERRERAFEKKRIKALQATMINATEIVNLLVASVKLFRYEAEATGRVSSMDIARLDAAIGRTHDQLEDLRNAKTTRDLQSVRPGNVN